MGPQLGLKLSLRLIPDEICFFKTHQERRSRSSLAQLNVLVQVMLSSSSSLRAARIHYMNGATLSPQFCLTFLRR